MRQLDLQRALLGLGAAAEDFQDEPGAIQHLCAPRLLEIALLDRRQRAIHHHEFDTIALDEAEYLLDLALAEIRRWPDLRDRRDQGVDHRQVDGARQPFGFIQTCFGIAGPDLQHLEVKGEFHSGYIVD